MFGDALGDFFDKLHAVLERCVLEAIAANLLPQNVRGDRLEQVRVRFELA